MLHDTNAMTIIRLTICSMAWTAIPLLMSAAYNQMPIAMGKSCKLNTSNTRMTGISGCIPW